VLTLVLPSVCLPAQATTFTGGPGLQWPGTDLTWCIAVWIFEATNRMNINPLPLLRFSTIFVSYTENTTTFMRQLLVYSRPNYTPNYSHGNL
jgi:hypothetical protein